MENRLAQLDKYIRLALEEDIGRGDITSEAILDEGRMAKAKILVKENCIIAGVELISMIATCVDESVKVETFVADGDEVKSGSTAAMLSGRATSLLKAERLILNCMQRMSGISTLTRRLTEMVKPYGTRLLDTRKTTPNFRVFEKWAVKIGGGYNHRFGLYDQMLIKDNHIQAAGGIEEALRRCKKYFSNHPKVIVVVEVKNEGEFMIALHDDIVDRILADNFSAEKLKSLMPLVNNKKTVEASGNITPHNMMEYAQAGVHFISMGYLTHHIAAVDISFKLIDG